MRRVWLGAALGGLVLLAAGEADAQQQPAPAAQDGGPATQAASTAATNTGAGPAEPQPLDSEGLDDRSTMDDGLDDDDADTQSSDDGLDAAVSAAAGGSIPPQGPQ